MTFSKEFYKKCPDFSKGKNNSMYGIRTGKKFEEIFGKEKAKQIKNKMSLTRKGKPPLWIKGKTWEALYGKERAKERRKKTSERMIGKNNPMWGKKRIFSEEWREAHRKTFLGKKRPEHSIRMKGKNNPFYGKKHSDKQKEKWRELHREQTKNFWQNLEYRDKVIKNTLKGLFKRPTSLERNFIEFIKKHNLPFSYCGDGSLLIGYKNPDFCENNGKKLCIEIYTKEFPKRANNWEQDRINHFAKYDWDCLIIEMEELKDEDKLLKKIRAFEDSGAEGR